MPVFLPTRFFLRVFLLCALLTPLALLSTAPPAWAQSAQLTKHYRQYLALNKAGKYREAVPHVKRLLKLGKREFGKEHHNIGTFLDYLAGLYRAQGRYNEAEPLFMRALKITEKALGRHHPSVATSLSNLASLYHYQGRYRKAEPLYRRSLKITGKAQGTDPTTLGNLAGLYKAQGRYREAEPLYRRSLKINEKALGRNHPALTTSLNNLAVFYNMQGRYSEAEQLYRRDLKIIAKALGADHPSVAKTLSNLAELYRDQQRYGEAEPLFRRSIEIIEKARGADHHSVATTLNNLAGLYDAQERHNDAELLYRRSLKINEKILGADHPDVAATFNNLAGLYFVQNDWQEAAANWRRASNALTRRAARGGEIGRGITTKKKSEIAQNSWYFWGLIKSVFREERQAGQLDETFKSVQWAMQSQAAGALAQMSARQSASSRELAKRVRERQDKVRLWQASEKRLTTLRGAGRSDPKLEAQMAKIDRRIAAIDKRLAREFPDYAALASPKPLAIKQVQKLLRPDEALVLLLDVPAMFIGSKKISPAETFIWAVTRERAIWKRAKLGGKVLAEKVTKLRCGLDGSNWGDPSKWPASDPSDRKAKAAQKKRRDKCIKLIGKSYYEDDWPPFDLATAYELYQKLLGPVENVIKGKKLLVVSSGVLTGLPLQVLVTQETSSSGPTDAKAYKNAPWLINSHALTTLPSVSSLKALRGIKGGKVRSAPNKLIGFADPVFSLPGTKPVKLASAAQDNAAPNTIDPNRGRVRRKRSTLRSYSDFFKGRNADLSTLAASLPQLDGTRHELLEVGRVLNIPTKDLLLGRAASERAVKKAKLDQYRIVYFATHGLIAGGVKGLAEPALAFSLPAKANALDDGLLTASEVTDLKLNADWLVMSACNTAAGDSPGAEALSGLARAFFYAGAKTLLVSHWPVDDKAAVALTTHAFNNMDRHPELGRAEALRHSMLAMIKKGKLSNVHPTIWAPFVVVGEGAPR